MKKFYLIPLILCFFLCGPGCRSGQEEPAQKVEEQIEEKAPAPAVEEAKEPEAPMVEESGEPGAPVAEEGEVKE